MSKLEAKSSLVYKRSPNCDADSLCTDLITTWHINVGTCKNIIMHLIWLTTYVHNKLLYAPSVL